MTIATPLRAGNTSSAPKTYRGGTHRLIAPEETVARMRRLVPVMGITRIADVTGLDCVGVPVVMVCRPNARSLAVSQGKGLTLAAATASGLMESIELYHAEHITLPLKLGSVEDLRYTHRLVDTAQLPAVTGSRFHPHFALLWIEGHDLLQDEPVWVPYELVNMDCTLPFPTGSGCFSATSNGLASGNHLLEAISHGICEVVERDATTLWSRRGLAAQHQTRIDLATVDDPGCRSVIDRCERAGIGVAVWETTSDVGIPAFLCLIVEREYDPIRPMYPMAGMGCHPVRQVALLRALTEAVQSRLTFISGARDDTFRSQYEQNRNPDVIQRFRAQLDVAGPMRSFTDVPTFESDTFDEDVAWELARLRAVGIERVVVVDLTKPELRVPVVRVVIPGLEGTDESPSYVPGARARTLMEAQS
jgi:ribosomal protein S12 methylthiotransferase accessory factor